jgi:hypothetical protein
MVFKAVTGELLFDRTAQHFADIKNRVIHAMRQAEALDPQLEEASRIFWRSAAAEFRTKMKAAESALRFVEADITPPAKALFVQVLKRDIESINTTIQKLIDAQGWFSSAGRAVASPLRPDLPDHGGAESQDPGGQCLYGFDRGQDAFSQARIRSQGAGRAQITGRVGL